MDGKYNKILVEFDFLIDLDMAMFKLIKAEYNNTLYVDQEKMRLTDEKKIIKMMIERQPINPLEILIPNIDTTELYNDLITNHMDELLKYAKACELFGLMVTFLKEASSLEITVLCDTESQDKYIKSLNDNFHTIVEPNHKNIALNKYTVLYVKYFPYVLKYNNLEGKHIYIANARFNKDPHSNRPTDTIAMLVGDVNIIHTIDMYRNIKLERVKKHE